SGNHWLGPRQPNSGQTTPATCPGRQPLVGAGATIMFQPCPAVLDLVVDRLRAWVGRPPSLPERQYGEPDPVQRRPRTLGDALNIVQHTGRVAHPRNDSVLQMVTQRDTQYLSHLVCHRAGGLGAITRDEGLR